MRGRAIPSHTGHDRLGCPLSIYYSIDYPSSFYSLMYTSPHPLTHHLFSIHQSVHPPMRAFKYHSSIHLCPSIHLADIFQAAQGVAVLHSMTAEVCQAEKLYLIQLAFAVSSRRETNRNEYSAHGGRAHWEDWIARKISAPRCSDGTWNYSEIFLSVSSHHPCCVI